MHRGRIFALLRNVAGSPLLLACDVSVDRFGVSWASPWPDSPMP